MIEYLSYVLEENMMQLPKMLMVLMCCQGAVSGLGLQAYDGKVVINRDQKEEGNWGRVPRIENMEYQTEAFEELPLSEQEQDTIEKIMHSLATYNIPKLLWKQKDLEKMGKSINQVHPLRFIGHIITQPILRSDLQEVHRSFFKWRGFLDGFRRRMTEEFYKGNLKAYLPGFCEELHIKEEVIDHFIDRRDWEGLVKAILY